MSIIRILRRGPPKHAPIAIRGKPCLAIVTLATASKWINKDEWTNR